MKRVCLCTVGRSVRDRRRRGGGGNTGSQRSRRQSYCTQYHHRNCPAGRSLQPVLIVVINTSNNCRTLSSIRVSWYQKGKTDLDFIEASDNEWQWHQLGHVQVSTSLQTDNHASTPPTPSVFLTPFLPPNQRRRSTEGNSPCTVHTRTHTRIHSQILHSFMGGSVAEWLACWIQAQKGRVQIAVATLSGNSLRQTVHTHRASVTAGLAESNVSRPPGL